jgi:hypothetical protein
MKALSRAELKIDYLDDELQFIILREIGWIEIALESGVLAAFGTCALLQQSLLLLCGCVIGIGGLVINWAQGPHTVFRISGRRLTATGNLHRWSASDVSIVASEVKSIGWSTGDNDRPSGIYVWHGQDGLKSTCVLPGLSEKKGQAVTCSIKGRFPQFTIKCSPVISASLGLEL